MRIFLSHSTTDDGFARELQQTLGEHRHDVWIDSRELRAGDALWPEIEEAIDGSAAYLVLVSEKSKSSGWVRDELRHALAVQATRGADDFPVIALMLNDTPFNAFDDIFGAERQPLSLAVRSEPGGAEAAMPRLLDALDRRHPVDVAGAPVRVNEPLEELVLELSEPRFKEHGLVRRPSARARLIYYPATPGQREIEAEKPWRFVAPIGPIEAADLAWYLQQYARCPRGDDVKQRARAVEQKLVEWGRSLHAETMGVEHTANVMKAWAGVKTSTGRRLSVRVDAALEANRSADDVAAARDAAKLLLGLPWELLHDGDIYLFQGATPVRVRRSLPNTRGGGASVISSPIRILVVTPRPEGEGCSYVDHRATVAPIVDIIEPLGALVDLHFLQPPTLEALGAELARTRETGRPYHVIHFNGVGVYDRDAGLTGLCFENPADVDLLDRRRPQRVDTAALKAKLVDHRIPLAVLDLYHGSAADITAESVASEALHVGVASIVAMSHGVVVETARHFVKGFYAALVRGDRIGDAMLEAQRTLKDNSFRGRVFGAGDLCLEDWFAPVLFQEDNDPRIFSTIPDAQISAEVRAGLATRLGELPTELETGFIGRSRDLLALERMLGPGTYAVVRGQSGEGKTTLAAELARWMVRSRQVRRAAFVSLDAHGDHAAVLTALGRQLTPTGARFTADDPDDAVRVLEQALTEQPTVLVLDGVESILDGGELPAILRLCARLQAAGETRLVFTTCEPLPAPFGDEARRRDLEQLGREDAIELVQRAIDLDGAAAATSADIERLVDTVHCHARTLALLAPALRTGPIESTRVSLAALMVEMQARFPGGRESSVYAGVELALRRMAPANRDRARVLGVFHGAAAPAVLLSMTGWDPTAVDELAGELHRVGVATRHADGHLTLNPALGPYLLAQLTAPELDEWTVRWRAAMQTYAGRLALAPRRDRAAAIVRLELPNLVALLEETHGAGDPAATIAVAAALQDLLQGLDRPRLLERVAEVRAAALLALGTIWNHASFTARATQIAQQLTGGHGREALAEAQKLLARAQVAGDGAYPGAPLDLAAAFLLLGRAAAAVGRPDQALEPLEEASRRLDALAVDRDDDPAWHLTSTCLGVRGDCLYALGRMDEAAAIYDRQVGRDRRPGVEHEVAIAKHALGNARVGQRRYEEALSLFAQAREELKSLEVTDREAMTWLDAGRAHWYAGQPRAAEEAYREALALDVQHGDLAGEAAALVALGDLYDQTLKRPEEAIALWRRAADRHAARRDRVEEGSMRHGLGVALLKLGRLDDARREAERAIACKDPLGYPAQPWATHELLAAIEGADGKPGAAAAAREVAISQFIAYRREGNENRDVSGRIALAVTEALRTRGVASAITALQHATGGLDVPLAWRPFVDALHAIIAGSRDRALADRPGLDCQMAAEPLLLIDRLDDQAALPVAS